jgi:glyoxylase-like metal-dependent hydrolase (beta-lactamase superfamily II)
MKTPYTTGLHEVGDGVFAWLQPDGSWGWSNAGLVADDDAGASLLVDTLFDLKLTATMLQAMRDAIPAAAAIGTVVNTHANGDHTFGNQLLAGARILASRRCMEEMADVPPQLLAGLIHGAPALGRTGEYLQRIFGPFQFEGITLTLPTDPFDGELTVMVGDRPVRLHEVGPAHTRGDVLVEVPDQRVVFTGDICFIGGHPIVWSGPVGNWIAALDRILAMDVDVVVPGHGPVSDKVAVAELKAYFEYLRAQTRARFEAGMSPMEAARDIDLDGFGGWTEAERLVVNVTTIYRELGAEVPTDALSLFSQMAELAP